MVLWQFMGISQNFAQKCMGPPFFFYYISIICDALILFLKLVFKQTVITSVVTQWATLKHMQKI